MKTTLFIHSSHTTRMDPTCLDCYAGGIRSYTVVYSGNCSSNFTDTLRRELQDETHALSHPLLGRDSERRRSKSWTTALVGVVVINVTTILRDFHLRELLDWPDRWHGIRGLLACSCCYSAVENGCIKKTLSHFIIALSHSFLRHSALLYSLLFLI